MLLRVVMITTLLLVAVYVETVSETLLPVNPLYFLIAATYGLTLFHVLALRFDSHHAAQVYVQVVLDLVIITGLVYLTGGPGSRAGFILLYPISVLSGSVLLYRRRVAAPRRARHPALRGHAVGGPRGLGARPGARRRAGDAGQAPALLDLRDRRGLRHRRPHRLLPLGEPGQRRPAARGGDGAGGGPSGADPGRRAQHPQRAHHRGPPGPRPLRQRVRGIDPRAPPGRHPRPPPPRRLRIRAPRVLRPRRARRPRGTRPARDRLPRAGRRGEGPRHLGVATWRPPIPPRAGTSSSSRTSRRSSAWSARCG